ncbi:MAG TPA: PKD domain-containing protein [Candidatus Bipolaricaulis sp.]|nr:PKD domain-containing protein [Candidatus Bipolaricaulis sp.]
MRLKLLICSWLAIATMFVLSGCGLMFSDVGADSGTSGALTADFTVQVVGKYKVILKAKDIADKYTWSFDDGTTITGGMEVSSVTHTYSDLGIYVVGLVVERGGGDGGSGGGTGGGGCCGPAPGGGGGSTPGTGTPEIAASHKAVDLLGGSDTLYPVLFFTTWVGGYVTDSFYPGQRVCVNAQESRGDGLTYRIEIVRVRSVEDPTPIPYCWGDEHGGTLCEPEIRYILTDQPSFCWYIDGPGGCTGETWTFRVTLRIRDKHWREATVTRFIYSGCCP